jgi:hypothetical protein
MEFNPNGGTGPCGVLYADHSFTEISHASTVRRFVSFDFATRRGIHVLIDVITTMSRGGASNRTALELARALKMPFVRVFIKPDFIGYMVLDAFEGGSVLVDQVKPLPQ